MLTLKQIHWTFSEPSFQWLQNAAWKSSSWWIPWDFYCSVPRASHKPDAGPCSPSFSSSGTVMVTMQRPWSCGLCLQLLPLTVLWWLWGSYALLLSCVLSFKNSIKIYISQLHWYKNLLDYSPGNNHIFLLILKEIKTFHEPLKYCVPQALCLLCSRDKLALLTHSENTTKAEKQSLYFEQAKCTTQIITQWPTLLDA